MAAHARDVARLAFREPGGRRAARACGCAPTFGCHSCVRRAGSVPRDCGQVRGYLAARAGAQNTAGFLDGTAVVADSSTIGSSSPRRTSRAWPAPPAASPAAAKIHGARLETEAGDRLRDRGAAGLLGRSRRRPRRPSPANRGTPRSPMQAPGSRSCYISAGHAGLAAAVGVGVPSVTHFAQTCLPVVGMRWVTRDVRQE